MNMENVKLIIPKKSEYLSTIRLTTSALSNINGYNVDDIEDLKEMADAQFDNDIQAMNEHAAPAEYNPIVGMALPIHKLILMNNVFDKGGIQKVTAVQAKFPISLERRILVKPDGTEIDMFLEQNKMTAAINSTNPTEIVELTLPVTETKDIITDVFGGTSLDNLDITTRIYAIQITGVEIEIGDIVPNSDGYIEKDGAVATAALHKKNCLVPY